MRFALFRLANYVKITIFATVRTKTDIERESKTAPRKQAAAYDSARNKLSNNKLYRKNPQSKGCGHGPRPQEADRQKRNTIMI